MSKTIIHGVKEDGTFDAECKSTAVLITELIQEFPKMCESEIYHALCDIRSSAESDTRIRQTYVHSIKCMNEDLKQQREELEYINDMDLKDFEAALIEGGIKAVRKCIEEHHDMESALAILKMCKAIGGDAFHVELVNDEEEKG